MEEWANVRPNVRLDTVDSARHWQRSADLRFVIRVVDTRSWLRMSKKSVTGQLGEMNKRVECFDESFLSEAGRYEKQVSRFATLERNASYQPRPILFVLSRYQPR